MDPTISKSQYVRGLQCNKALWLFRNRKDLQLEPSSAKKDILEVGNLIGKLAMDNYLTGVEVTNEYWDINGAIKATKKYIDDGNNIIFEATALHPITGAYSKIDILKRVDDTDLWDLIEVKSSTQVKEYHKDDLAFQYYVFSNSGYKIRNSYMMLIDNSYERIGDIDPTKILRLVDITEQVKNKQNHVNRTTIELCNSSTKSGEPKEKIGEKCFKPFECDFKSYCWKHVPDYSIYNIFQKKKAESIENKHGVLLESLPTELFPSGKKRVDLECYFDKSIKIDKEKISDFLESLNYPIYFFDYETIAPAIPILEGTKPFQQIPFQFSLHVQKKRGQQLEHFEYIHKVISDPRPNLIEKLIQVCGKKGSILVYNQSFEIARNNELAEKYTKYGDELRAINARIIDLMLPFSKRWIYHPDQQGSASLKKVLPAFTDLNYEDLEVGNGSDAMRLYNTFMEGKLEKLSLNMLWDGLSKYCERDTYALWVLLEVLQNTIEINLGDERDDDQISKIKSNIGIERTFNK
ncbi:DUF2779 domain-containing protein [Amylibacter sp.]|nr:DUF2779 domain-containing protein [Amylibacter sp.]